MRINMPLVSMDTIKKWYKKDSFIYKNFEYIWKNPLWDMSSKIPRGFSVCPYFWISILVGFVFMRMLFVPLMRPLFFCGKCLSMVSGNLEERFRYKLADIFERCGVEVNGLKEKPGFGWVLLFLSTIISLLSIAVIAIICGTFLFIYAYYLSVVNLNSVSGLFGATIFYGCIIFIILVLITFCHRVLTINDYNRCNVKYYVYIYVAIWIVALSVIGPSHMWRSFSALMTTIFYSIIWKGIICNLIWLLGQIIWAFSHLIGLLGSTLVLEFLGVPLWAFFLVVLILGFLLSAFDKKIPMKKNKLTSRDELIRSIIKIFEYDGNCALWIIEDYIDKKDICWDMEVYTMLSERLFKDYITKNVNLPNKLLEMDTFEYQKLNEAYENNFKKYRNFRCGYYKAFVISLKEFEIDPRFMHTLNLELRNKEKIINIFEEEYLDTYLSLSNHSKEKDAKRKIKREKCRKMTESANSLFFVLVSPLVMLYKGLWSLFIYSLILIKAKKEEVCPFLMFEGLDGEDENAKKS